MEQQIIENGGLQYVPQIAVQYVYLDFDGESTTYRNEDLNITIEVDVDDSGMSDEQKRYILAELSEKYANKNIVFTAEKPEDIQQYSTIFIGKTDDFDEYGTFAGLAETIDIGNQIKNDNAFVMQDSTADSEKIIEIIAHETDHLTGTSDHGGEGLNRYALDVLLSESSATCNVEVKCSGGYNPGDPYTISSSWTTDMPDGATKAVITVTNNGIAESYHWETCNTNIYLTIGDAEYTIPEEKSMTFVVYSDTNLTFDRSTYLEPDVAYADYIYSKLNPSHVLGYRYYYYSAYVRNTVTISVKYYQHIPIPDLQITDVNFSRQTPDTVRFDPTESFSYSFTVKNSGDLDAASSKAYLYIDNEIYKEISVAALAAGASRTYSCNFAPGSLANGAHTIYVLADGAGIIAEDDDNNNTSPETTFIIESAKADLAVANFDIVSADGDILARDVDISVTLTVENRSGNKKSAAATAELYAGSTLLAKFNIPVIEPGKTYDISYKIPARTLSGGATEFKCVLDSGNQCNEFNEENNASTVSKCIFIPEKLVILKKNNKFIEQKTSLDHADLGYGETAEVYDSGTMEYAEIFNSGNAIIRSGGIANSTTINTVGGMLISNGGTANNTTVNSYAYMHISSGGTADSTVINSNGTVDIGSGGIANNTTIYSGGEMHISNGGSANNTTLDGGYVTEGMYISNGGVANQTTVNNGYMFIANGGSANDTFINSNGEVVFQSGGSANNITISGGYLYISSGGSANNVNWTPCEGTIHAEDGAFVNYTSKYSGIYFGSDNQLLSRANSVTEKYVSGYNCSMYIMSGGKADDTILTGGGTLYVHSGGVANQTTAADYCRMIISSGGIANTVSLNSGTMSVCSAGTANDVNIDCGAALYVSNGGTVNRIKENGGYVSAAENANVSFESSTISALTIDDSNLMTVHSGTTASYVTVEKGRLLVYDGGIADYTSVNCGKENSGGMEIYSGGTATNILVDSGWGKIGFEVAPNTYIDGDYGGSKYYSSTHFAMQDGKISNFRVHRSNWIAVKSGGTAADVVVESYGSMTVCSGGTATNIAAQASARLNITVAPNTYITGTYANSAFEMKNAVLSGYTFNSYCSVCVESGGVASNTTVDSAGRMYIFHGGTANSTTVNSSGSMTVSSGGTASGTVVNFGGSMYVSSGGTANNTTVNNDGCMKISSGGSANNITISDGFLTISSGGVANNTTIGSYGYMTIASGGIHRGSLQIASGACISAESGSIVDFTVADRTTADGYLINDLKLLSGTPTYSITVSANQKSGTYKLAQGAENFFGTISIGNSISGYKTITVNGKSIVCNNKTYSLDETNGNLTLTVTSSTGLSNLQGNINGISWNGNADFYVVAYSKNNFANSLKITTTTNAVDICGMPTGTYQWKVSSDGKEYNGNNIVATNTAAQHLISDADGNMDLFFGKSIEKWKNSYAAEHHGILNGWSGTGEQVNLAGKNKISDVFAGSTDANVLVLTDDTNGDALFVDDIYTALGDQARISQIDEIRAGLGDDIVDMTSQRFVYDGNGVTIYGGLGDDTIWANSGNNILFGDAGNDRIVGSTGFDLIVGGAGNDSMHSGGGNDIFAFCENWGVDTVQLTDSDSSITLWFASGSESNWDYASRTYRNGSNSVSVIGGTGCTINLKFGDVAGQYDDMVSVGAFESATSEKIFEDKNSGMLA